MNEDDILFVAGRSAVATMFFKQVNRLLLHAGRIVVFNDFRVSKPAGQAFHQGIVTDFVTCQKNAGSRVSDGIFDVREENQLFGKTGINDHFMSPAGLNAPLIMRPGSDAVQQDRAVVLRMLKNGKKIHPVKTRNARCRLG
ncbi:hypothetical protein ACE2AK_23630 [Rahnella perminowiae]|uniref:hypothetical protein n=1 Tax=Rahnella TaxID=34037 RepID=UPI001C27FEA6|nr:hypothetical protein [Rahnella aceris]MBU9849252.1 hypothetical protein [Rahnella aceris]MBU9858817.1 hypothetical protein [Rahnella aceris]